MVVCETENHRFLKVQMFSVLDGQMGCLEVIFFRKDVF